VLLYSFALTGNVPVVLELLIGVIIVVREVPGRKMLDGPKVVIEKDVISLGAYVVTTKMYIAPV
jgi:hypothetical protein